jgi:hypothetical protein
VTNCIEAVMCAIGCVDLNGFPPSFSFACVSNCTAQACPSAQLFIDNVLTCAVQALPMCFGGGGGGGIFNCIQMHCGPEINACIGATCN